MMSYKDIGRIFCEACYVFDGTTDQCSKDEDGNLYCPICDNFLMDGQFAKSDITKLSEMFSQTGLVFQDYLDYFKQLDPVEYAIRPEFGILKDNDELSFNTLDAHQYEKVMTVIDHENIGRYVSYTRKATDKQIMKIIDLQKEMKSYHSDMLILGYIDLEGLYQVQATRLITALQILKWMRAPITFKQVRFIEKIEKEMKHYFYFDDMLTKEGIDTVLDTKSKLEGQERISIFIFLKDMMKHIHLNELYENINNWMRNIKTVTIPYNDVKDDVIAWKQRRGSQ